MEPLGRNRLAQLLERPGLELADSLSRKSQRLAGLLEGVLLLAAAAPLPPGGSFIDDDGSIFEPSIEAIAAANITRSCNPPTSARFCPDPPATRAQLAAFLPRAKH